MKRKQGFTLAEILITLAIIGLISALTLPAIQANTAAARNRAALKKAMATLSQAAENNLVQNKWNYALISVAHVEHNEGRDQNASQVESVFALLNSNLSGETHLGNISDGRPANGQYHYNGDVGSGAWWAAYQLSDGAIIGLNRHATYCTAEQRTAGNCIGFIDVNGMAGPHREITCEGGGKRYLWQDDQATCTVERSTNADIFPIVFYDNTIELASDAAKAFFNAR